MRSAPDRMGQCRSGWRRNQLPLLIMPAPTVTTVASSCLRHRCLVRKRLIDKWKGSSGRACPKLLGILTSRRFSVCIRESASPPEHVKTLPNQDPPGLPHPSPELGILQQFDQHIGNSIDLTWRDKGSAYPIADYFAHTTDICRDHRPCTS